MTRAVEFRAALKAWIVTTEGWSEDQFVEAICPFLVTPGRGRKSPLMRCVLRVPAVVLVRLEAIVLRMDGAIPKDLSRGAVIRAALEAWWVTTKSWPVPELIGAIRPSLARRGFHRAQT